MGKRNGQIKSFADLAPGYEEFMREWQNEHHRFRSYDPCKEYFDAHYEKKMTDVEAEEVYNECALRLFYYLMSWGMLRNKDWMIWKSHKVFFDVVKVLFNTDYKYLWNLNPLRVDLTADGYATAVKPLYDAVLNALKKTLKEDDKKYPPQGEEKNVEHTITPLLICKILMGTYGCVIAYDNYDTLGMRTIAVTVSSDLVELFKNTYNLITDDKNREIFCQVMKDMENYPVNYTVFKVLDMILWIEGEKIEKKNQKEKRARTSPKENAGEIMKFLDGAQYYGIIMRPNANAVGRFVWNGTYDKNFVGRKARSQKRSHREPMPARDKNPR